MLQRTQIMLDDKTKADLEFLSIKKGESMSSLVRKFLKDKIKQEKKKIPKESRKTGGAEALLKMAEEAEKIDKKYGSNYPTDLSINHDYYLYGAPKVKSK